MGAQQFGQLSAKSVLSAQLAQGITLHRRLDAGKVEIEHRQQHSRHQMQADRPT